MITGGLTFCADCSGFFSILMHSSVFSFSFMQFCYYFMVLLYCPFVIFLLSALHFYYYHDTGSWHMLLWILFLFMPSFSHPMPVLNI